MKGVIDMVKYYVTLDIFGERECLQALKEFCNEHNVMLEINERFDRDSYKEYKESAKSELGFEDPFRAYMTFRNNPHDCERIIKKLEERDDINICIKIDC